MRQRRAALGGLANLGRLGARRIVFVQLELHQVARADDGREHVVEIVRDAAREPRDGLHPLRASQLILERAPLGNVLGNPFEAGSAVLELDRARRHVDEDRRSVLAFPPEIGRGMLAAAEARDHRVAILGPLIEVGHPARHQVRRGVVAEHPRERGVGVENRPRERRAINAVCRAVDERPVARFGAAELLLDRFLMGNVAGDPVHAGQTAVLVHELHVLPDPDERSVFPGRDEFEVRARRALLDLLPVELDRHGAIVGVNEVDEMTSDELPLVVPHHACAGRIDVREVPFEVAVVNQILRVLDDVAQTARGVQGYCAVGGPLLLRYLSNHATIRLRRSSRCFSSRRP